MIDTWEKTKSKKKSSLFSFHFLIWKNFSGETFNIYYAYPEDVLF